MALRLRVTQYYMIGFLMILPHNAMVYGFVAQKQQPVMEVYLGGKSMRHLFTLQMVRVPNRGENYGDRISPLVVQDEATTAACCWDTHEAGQFT